MKIAYLISAYTDPIHLKRLINALDCENAYFFVHVDKKSDFEKFYFNQANVIWLEKRILVTWGGYSQVKVIFNMLQAALEYREDIEYFVSMTGTDYPIMSNEDIVRMFEAGRQWICGYRTPEDRNCMVMTNDLLWNNMIGHIERRIRKVINSFWKQKPFTYINKQKAVIFQGSDYWALSRACAEDMLRLYHENLQLRIWMKTAFIPSELMMTTIFFNSRWKNMGFELKGQNVSFQEMTPLHYVVYEDKIKVMKEEDFDNIVSSGKMFFRKAETGTSDKLLRLIDMKRKS